MPTPTRPKKRQYSQEDVQKAVDAVNNGMSLSAAAKGYGVPKTTLHDRLHNKYTVNAPLGRPSVLTSDEEELIVEWVISIAKSGFPISKDQLIASVSKLVKDLNRPNPFTDNVPGEKWYNLFLNRHPDIAKRVSQALTTSRANVTEEQIRQWFCEVSSYLQEKELSSVLKDPRRVFNADETAFFLCPKGNKVLARKGEKIVYSKTGNDEKECLTVLVTANAAGDLAPPMVLFSYERYPAAVVKNFPDTWGIGKSENGWMTGETFYEFMANVFHPWLVNSEIPLPILFFIDGHTSHVTKHLSDFCTAKKIELIALYPNATHLLQPMDVAVFRPLKGAWRKAVQEWRFNHGGRKMKKEEFAPLLKEVFDNSMKKDTIKSGFISTGLSDLNPDRLNFKKLTNKNPLAKTHLEQKIKEVTSHLSFLESKIGLNIVRNFNANIVENEEKSLFKVWRSIHDEISSLKRELIVNGGGVTVENANNDGESAEEEMPLREITHDNVVIEGTVVAEHGEATDNQDLLQEIVSGLEENYLYPDQTAIEVTLDVHHFDISEIDQVLPISENSNQEPQPQDDNTNLIIPGDGETNLDVTMKEVHSPRKDMTPSKPSTSTNAPTIPSPFKRCLFWPEAVKGAEKKRKLKEKIPSVLTSKKYKDYLEKKENEKKQKEEEKEMKRQIREAKKTIKKEGGQKKCSKTTELQLTDTEEEEDFDLLPSTSITDEERNSISVNDWVVVAYEIHGNKENFVGQIKSIIDEKATIKFLAKRGNKFAWPEEDDIDNDVPLQEVLQILSVPSVERRGFFTFRERIQ